MKRQHPEQALQRAIVGYLSAVLTERSWFTSIPAGGGGKVRGAILKATGYKAGTPDLLIIHDGEPFWAELKSDKGRCSVAQINTANDLLNAGCYVPEIIRSLDDMRTALRFWKIPTRERTL